MDKKNQIDMFLDAKLPEEPKKEKAEAVEKKIARIKNFLSGWAKVFNFGTIKEREKSDEPYFHPTNDYRKAKKFYSLTPRGEEGPILVEIDEKFRRACYFFENGIDGSAKGKEIHTVSPKNFIKIWNDENVDIEYLKNSTADPPPEVRGWEEDIMSNFK